MKPVDELNLLLELIRKYNLPLSPIMEYAINQKKEELSDTPSEEDTIVKNIEPLRKRERNSISKAAKVYDYNIDDGGIEFSDDVPSSIETSKERLITGDNKKKTHDVQGFDGQRENRQGKPWTETEEHIITQYFEEGYNAQEIALSIGRTELGVKIRLGKLGLIDFVYGQEDSNTEQQSHPKVQADESPINESDDEMEIEHVYLDEKGNVVRREMRGQREKIQYNVDEKAENDSSVDQEVDVSEELEIDSDLEIFLNTAIRYLPLSDKTSKLLIDLGYDIFEEIPQIESSQVLISFRKGGLEAANEVEQYLENYNLTFGMSYEEIIGQIVMPDEVIINELFNSKEEKKLPRTIKETLNYAKMGFTFDTIASKRRLSLYTISQHLSILIQRGFVDVFDFVDRNTYTLISNVIQDLPGDVSSKTIKSNCPKRIKRNTIRMVMADLKRKRKTKN